MKGVPKELDELMWEVASTGDLKAIAEFAERHPQHASELRARARSISQLKASEARVESDFVPPFRPVPISRPRLRLNVLIPAAIALACFSIAGARMSSNRAKAALNPVPATNKEEQKPSPNPNFGQTARVETFEVPPELVPEPPSTAETPAANPVAPSQALPLESPGARSARPSRHCINFQSVPLHTALKAISGTYRVEIQIAPGLPNPEIEFSVEDATLREILDRLGAEYAFKAVEERPRQYLVIPLPEPENDAVPLREADSLPL